MKVPFMDLSGCFKDIRPEVDDKINEIIDNTAFIGGREVKEFEKEFALYQGTEFCSACSNGTDALILALIALDVKMGDTVLLPANTFIATAEAVCALGAKPDFIDVDSDTYTMSPVHLAHHLQHRSKKPACIIPVHLYGYLADMAAIMDIADKYGIPVIEDAAQAHGAERNGKRAGHFGRAATFSFYPGKNLGAFGDAGAVVTNDEGLHKKISMLIDHGRDREKYMHYVPGFNKRMDAMQAAVLRIKLRYLNKWTQSRVQNAQYYTEHLGRTGKCPDSVLTGHVYHIFPYHTEHRDELKQFLKERDISTGIHYPVPLHLQPAFDFLGYSEGGFPNAEYNASHELSLPLWPEMLSKQMDYVIDSIRRFK